MAWKTGWGKRIAVTFTSNGSLKTDYGVRAVLTSSQQDLFDFADCNGEDIRITDSDGTTDLDYWLKEYDTCTPRSEIRWHTTIPASGDETNYIYFDKASETSASDIQAAGLFGEDWLNRITGDDEFGTRITLGNTESFANNPIIGLGGCGDWNESEVRECSNPVKIGSTWHLLVTGVDSSGAKSIGLYTASAPEGPWTEYACNPVIEGLEDPHIVMEWGSPGTPYQDGCDDYLVYGERWTGSTDERDIAGYSTADFISYTSLGVVLDPSTDCSEDNFWVGSPTCVHRDDGVNDRIYMIYEGNTSYTAQDVMGLAWADVCDPTSFTKYTDPCSCNEMDIFIDHGGMGTQDEDGVVPDWLLYNGSTKTRLVGHASPACEGDFSTVIYETTDDPEDWDSSSFSLITNSFMDGSPQCQLFEGHTSELYIVWNLTASGFLVAENINTSRWEAQRQAGIDDGFYRSVIHSPIDTGNDVLDINIQTAGSQASHSAAMISKGADLTDNFRICISWRTLNNESTRLYNIFGAGIPGELNGPNGAWEALLDDGYFVQIQRWLPTSGQTFMVTVDVGCWDSEQTTSQSQTFLQAFNEWELSLYGGTLNLTIPDACIDIDDCCLTADHSCDNKEVLIGAGAAAGLGGGDMECQWVYVEHYDGTEFSASFGATENDPSLSRKRAHLTI